MLLLLELMLLQLVLHVMTEWVGRLLHYELRPQNCGASQLRHHTKSLDALKKQFFQLNDWITSFTFNLSMLQFIVYFKRCIYINGSNVCVPVDLAVRPRPHSSRRRSLRQRWPHWRSTAIHKFYIVNSIIFNKRCNEKQNILTWAAAAATACACAYCSAAKAKSILNLQFASNA